MSGKKPDTLNDSLLFINNNSSLTRLWSSASEHLDSRSTDYLLKYA